MKTLMTWVGRLVMALILMAGLAYGGACGYLFVVQRDKLYSLPPGVPPLPVAQVPGIKDVHLKTPDGAVLRAWYLPPRGQAPVFLFLGGKGASLGDHMGRYKRMAQKGEGFLALAYRGFSGSTGKPTEDGLFMDGLVAYDWLKKAGYAPQQIVIHGHSLGSGVATYVATQRPAKGLILEAPFTAASDVAQDIYPYVPVQWLMLDKFANRDRIGFVHMPILIVHGDRDTIVPFAQGERLYALAPQPKTFKRMAGEDHSTLTRAGVYDVYDTWLKSLD
ncbi:alpha/beta hydrolase [Asticcacaulis excentricus]|nr:alpha/beta hydrolase [Asticcacaulis excentricus]